MIRRRLACHRGFTLVETMVASLILVVGLLGTLTAMSSGKRLTSGSQRSQQAYAYAQSHLEKVAALPWDELGLSSLPTAESGSAPGNPAAYLVCSGATCSQLAIHQDPGDPASPPPSGVSSPETIITASGGAAPKVALPNGAGTVYQYVTEATDQCIVVSSTRRCPKRITVAVRLATDPTSGSMGKPVWVSTVVTEEDTA